MTESEVKKIVRDLIKTEIDKVNKKIDSNKENISNLQKKSVTEDEVKKIVRTMFINHYKWMWEKSSIYINKL